MYLFKCTSLEKVRTFITSLCGFKGWVGRGGARLYVFQVGAALAADVALYEPPPTTKPSAS